MEENSRNFENKIVEREKQFGTADEGRRARLPHCAVTHNHGPERRGDGPASSQALFISFQRLRLSRQLLHRSLFSRCSFITSFSARFSTPLRACRQSIFAYSICFGHVRVIRPVRVFARYDVSSHSRFPTFRTNPVNSRDT